MKRNAKSILTLLLALVMVLSLFTACGGDSQTTEPSEAASNEPVKLWYGYNTENFMQDLEYEDLEYDDLMADQWDMDLPDE